MAYSVAQVVHEYWDGDLPRLFDRDTSGMLGDDLIRDLVGPRRSGKTYLMYLLISQIRKNTTVRATLYLNFEDRRILPLKEAVFNEIVELIHSERLLDFHPRIYLFLDEIQAVPGWERFVRSLYDEFKGRMKIVVTGSCSDLITEDYAGLLTGRHLTRIVFPLGFSEYLTFKGRDPSMADRTEKDISLSRSLFEDFLIEGGFPEVVLAGDRRMASQLFTDIISRDIASRSGVRNRGIILDLADFLSRNAGNLVSFSKLSKFYSSTRNPLSVPTLIKYFNVMKEAFLFFDSTIWSSSKRDQRQYPRKVYCIDNSFLPDAGKGILLENAVAIELLRRGKELHYWRDPRHRYEVDFIVRDNDRETLPIQVCADLNDPFTLEREARSLEMAIRDVGSERGMIVTMDQPSGLRLEKIEIVPAWRFFLQSSVESEVKRVDR